MFFFEEVSQEAFSFGHMHIILRCIVAFCVISDLYNLWEIYSLTSTRPFILDRSGKKELKKRVRCAGFEAADSVGFAVLYC